MAEVVGPEILNNGVVTQIGILIKPPNGWRVRSETVKMVGALSIAFGKEVYLKHFEQIFMSYLTNSAAAVRQEGIV